MRSRLARILRSAADRLAPPAVSLTVTYPSIGVVVSAGNSTFEGCWFAPSGGFTATR